MNRPFLCTIAACVFGFGIACASAQDSPPATAPTTAPATLPTTRPDPKPLSENVHKGLAYLIRAQLPSGAWAQGDESAAMGNTMDNVKASPNVADTCMATLALLRGGSSPKQGEYQDQILRAIGFVCDQIDHSSESDLYVTEVHGTRTQMKLGTYIDTFVAAQLLGEVKNGMPDAATTKRVNDALAKVLKKMQTNQQNDGRWANQGWAPVLAQGQAAKSINIAAQNGASVDEKTREAVEQVARGEFAISGKPAAAGAPGAVFAGGMVSVSGATTRAVSAVGGDAGVELYSRASQVAAMQASANSNGSFRYKYNEVANSPTTSPTAKAEAQAILKRFDDNDRDLAAAQSALVERMQDKQFAAGFGSNGGEEFLSYLNIAESLIIKSGNNWTTWDKSMTENLNRVQNEDGSWSGQHCITGRTFCTSAALMVLTVDRAPVPVAAAVQQAKGR